MGGCWTLSKIERRNQKLAPTQEPQVTGVPVGEAVGDVIFRNGGQLLVNVQKKQRIAFPSIDMVVALLENSVTVITGQGREICIYM